MINNKKNFTTWLCLGILFWIVFKNPICFLLFLAIGVLVDRKKN